MSPRDMVRVPASSNVGPYRAPDMRMGRSQFDLSHTHKTCYDAGQLIPYFLTEVIPGDTMTVRLEAFTRIFSPLDFPIMDNIEQSIDFFFVPNRLVWDNWEAFLGAHDDAGAQDTDYTIPIHADGTTIALGSVWDYMGVPIGLQTTDVELNQLPIRGYRLIYNEWYRDQNLIDAGTIDKGNGPNVWGNIAPYKSAKKHDYFTSALPYLQKGDPVSAQFPVTGIGMQTTDFVTTSQAVYETAESAQQTYATAKLVGDAAAGNQIFIEEDVAPYADRPAIYANITINALREAAAIQRLLERDARGGTRMRELIQSHFGVDTGDARVQRPEYLGGGRGWINVTPVPNTSATATQDQGELAGFGTGVLRASFAKSFVEHGYVFGILRARGEVSYQQGLDRMWSRQTKYEFLWPELSQLGEQAILNKELYISNDANDDLVFGYQERYAEYRFKKSLVTHKFASNAAGSLDFCHLSEDFTSLPALNQTFIEDQTPMARVTTVDTEPDFIIDGRFDFKVARALPVRPVPTLMPARF